MPRVLRKASLWGLLLVVVAFSLQCSSSPPRPGTVSDSAMQSMLALEFSAFDQDMEGGWRHYERAGHHAAAAHALDAYRTDRAGLQPWQRILLAFHAGQMHAYSGETDTAVARFRMAVDTEHVGPGWAPYVRGTIAFLQRDREGLDRAYQDLIAAPELGGPDPNIQVLQSFRVHFDWDYAQAYEASNGQ